MSTNSFFRFLHAVQYSFSVILVSCILLSSWGLSAKPKADSTKKWVGTWSTSPQLVEPGNMPPEPGLSNNSLRQVVRVSTGGDMLRIRFSNEFSKSPVTMRTVQIAVSRGGSAIDGSTMKELKFNGKSEVTMDPGLAITSDPIAFKLTPRMDVAITISYGQTSATTTGHPGSRTTSYLLAGNATSTTDFTGAVTTDHWYNINAIDVLAPSPAACIAILGNSITDGRGSTTNMQNRWPDVFSESLLKNPGTLQVGVLNLGIGGNCVLSGGLGPTAVSRYERDILNQAGVRWAVVFIGVNDIGGVKTADAATTKTNDLIAAFQQMIAKAHAKNIRIYGATILPFNGNGYYNPYSETCRSAVNQWIRTKGHYDRVIDFEKAMRNPQDTLRLLSTYQNDGLHPDAAGYKTMGEFIDVNWFTGSDTIFNQESHSVTGSIGNEIIPSKAGSTINGLNRKLGSQMSTASVKGSFALIVNGKPSPLVYSSNDFAGVAKAMNYFRADLKMVSGTEPGINIDQLPEGQQLVVAGTVGHSLLIDQLVREKKINLDELNGKWEKFVVQVVENAFPGVRKTLVIAGSDKRGTIYGIFELSKQMGVSPWYWWADVPVEAQSNIYVKAERFTLGEPAVKYRGIFLNDEEPALGRWAVEKFGGFNHQFYEKLFELMLRMKSNYLWPAMWWASFNTDDQINPTMADEMGIVMSTTHHEPMMRAHAEWKQKKGIPWNYETSPDTLRQFWKEGIERMGKHESIVSMGMRGDGDMAMSAQTNIALLERIVADQRKIIGEVTQKPVSETPQLWALYKEVQDYYDNGMRVPDDVTLLLCDDNWGNNRKLPKPGEAKRAGGYGIYYHFDYVGDPRNYKWLNTCPIERTWEQMNMAYRHGVDRIWVVNVGDLKPMEFPIEFFLDFAWNPDQWPADKLFEYTRKWAENQFGSTYATQIASLLDDYTRFNSRRKPELLEPTTYSLTNYQEADRIVSEYNELTEKAQALYKMMPANYKDAFYQLVLHPIVACANLNELYVTVGKNRLYATQGRASANDLAEKARQLYQKDADLSDFFNKQLAGGKWNHMMDQTHIGYTYWQQPDKNSMPEVKTIEIQKDAEMGIVLEGSDKWWPQSSEKAVLPQFDPLNCQRCYIDLFNRGSQPFDAVITPASSRVKVSAIKIHIEKEARIWVEANWKKMPTVLTEVPITISGSGKSVEVMAVLNPLLSINPKQSGFVESNGYIAIEAEHYTNLVNKGEAGWLKVPGLGRTLSAMMPVPVNSTSLALGKDSPHMEYDVLFNTAGEVSVSTLISPTQNIYNNEGLCFAVSFDDQQPQIVNIHKGKTQQDWQESVRRNIVELPIRCTIEKAGKHVLKIWMIDPGIVLQRIHINCGGLKPSYLGPLESKNILKD